MRLKTLRDELKKRGLELHGSREDLELRLRNAFTGRPIEDAVTKKTEPDLVQTLQGLNLAETKGAGDAGLPNFDAKLSGDQVQSKFEFGQKPKASAQSLALKSLLKKIQPEDVPMNAPGLASHSGLGTGRDNGITGRLGNQRVPDLKDRVSQDRFPKHRLGLQKHVSPIDRLGKSYVDLGGPFSPQADGNSEDVFSEVSTVHSAFEQRRGYKRQRENMIVDANILNVQFYQEYDIEKMEERADRFSDVPCLRKRARRFNEECANELVQVKEAKRKNLRFNRFSREDEENDSDSEEEDE